MPKSSSESVMSPLPARPRKLRFLDPVGTDDRIRGRVFCVECGADLRGKLISALCDCGHTVTDSVYGDFLMYQEQRDLRRLNGALGLLQYVGIALVALVGLGVISAVRASASAEQAVEGIFDVIFSVTLLTPLPATLGITLVTRKRSLAYYRARYGDNRFLAIATGALAILIVLLVFVPDSYRKAFKHTLLVAFAAVPSLIFLIGFSRLMRHMPHRGLAALSFGAFVATCVLAALAWGVLILRPVSQDSYNTGGLVLTLSGLAILISLGVAAATIRMLIKARRSVAAYAR